MCNTVTLLFTAMVCNRFLDSKDFCVSTLQIYIVIITLLIFNWDVSFFFFTDNKFYIPPFS